MYKVLIPTSGLGTRLGEFSKYTNKALVRVGKKSAISYIVERYPEGTEFVITHNHFGEHIQEFMKIAYPHTNVTYILTQDEQGPSNNLLESLLYAEEALQCPFVIHVADTIITEPEDWDGTGTILYSESVDDTSSYRTHIVQHGILKSIGDKGTPGKGRVHIGVSLIEDYEAFWNNAHETYDCRHEFVDKDLSDCHIFDTMLINGCPIGLTFPDCWYDVGNQESLQNARENIYDKFDMLDKPGQSVFVFADKVVKFFHDPKAVVSRVIRADILGETVPNILKATPHFYSYEKARGRLLADQTTDIEFGSLLGWLQCNLWDSKIQPTPETQETFLAFYKHKTYARVKQFHDLTGMEDTPHLINVLDPTSEEATPTVQELLDSVDWEDLSIGLPTRKFHGDLHFSNILKTKDGFKLLDWREDFGNTKNYGDLYYDLAKLKHGLLVNHNIVAANKFNVVEYDYVSGPNFVDYEMDRKPELIACEVVFSNFLKYMGYDEHRVNILTALIFLNIAALHHEPYNRFLYFLGKDLLYKALQEEKF